ncbi:MAG: VapC toxin family PIN domain ribonuclease [Chloroflexi bacterium CG_4_10_14_0_8_um_filter_57_5]|nr:MAG: VapC toxin family PIN domain ribonuclease [Chloroflexi bacterium CG_4_10_14_0_8_um_filter_57_5]
MKSTPNAKERVGGRQWTMKILDSDHCIAILRGQLDLRGQVAPEDELAITAVSVGELTHGAHKSKHAADNLARLDVLLSTLTVLVFDEYAARRFGALKARLESTGAGVSDMDLQIASIALECSAPLVTHNQRHFSRIPSLTLEDWL